MGLREHLLDQHGWNEGDEGFDTMDEVDRVNSHNDDHQGGHPPSHTHCPICYEVEITIEGDSNPVCAQHGPQIVTVAKECIICGLLVLVFPNDNAPVCSTHPGGTA